MALKDLVGKVATRTEAGEMAAAPRPNPESARAPARVERGSPAALLDASVEFKGTMRCRESIRIDGRCEGELRSDRAVIIGQPAVLHMSIEADTVVVAGEVIGNITAQTKIALEPTARVTGNLCTPGIVIQEGAKLEGRIVIGSELEPAAAPESRRTAPEPEPRAEPGPPRPRKPTPGAPPPVS